MLRTRLLPAICLAASAAAQTGAPQEFEAAVIKPYQPSGAIKEACNPHGDPGLLYYVGCTLFQLVTISYDLKQYEVAVKAPAWVENDPYVVQARSASAISRSEMKRMLQTLLAARFHMTVHWEERQAPGYLLQTGSRGLKLAAAVKTDKCGQFFRGDAILRSDCLTLDDLAAVLQSVLGVPVSNHTSIASTNLYQLKLEWSKDDDSATVIPTLIQDCGLILKAGKAPLRMLVIDAASRPDAN